MVILPGRRSFLNDLTEAVGQGAQTYTGLKYKQTETAKNTKLLQNMGYSPAEAQWLARNPEHAKDYMSHYGPMDIQQQQMMQQPQQQSYQPEVPALHELINSLGTQQAQNIMQRGFGGQQGGNIQDVLQGLQQQQQPQQMAQQPTQGYAPWMTPGRRLSREDQRQYALFNQQERLKQEEINARATAAEKAQKFQEEQNKLNREATKEYRGTVEGRETRKEQAQVDKEVRKENEAYLKPLRKQYAIDKRTRQTAQEALDLINSGKVQTGLNTFLMGLGGKYGRQMMSPETRQAQAKLNTLVAQLAQSAGGGRATQALIKLSQESKPSLDMSDDTIKSLLNSIISEMDPTIQEYETANKMINQAKGQPIPNLESILQEKMANPQSTSSSRPTPRKTTILPDTQVGAKASQYKGRPILDESTGLTYRSNGKQWVLEGGK